MEALQRLHNRGSISTGYNIDNSLCMEDANDESMIRNYSGDGDRRTWTYSTWVKKLKFGSNYDYMYLFGAANTSILFLNDDRLRIELYNGSSTVHADTSMLFRDGSAWYHIIVTLDSTQGTASDRVKIWINGVRVTDFNNSTYANMSQNAEFNIGQASSNYQFGYWFAGGANNRAFSGYVAETHYVNGTALDETSFGEFDEDSGIWKPKEYTGSHGTKGFYFKFDDASNLGKDSATNGIGDFSENNITAIDQSTDTPTNNFCTLNPLFVGNQSTPPSDGATYMSDNGTNQDVSYAGTMGVTKGKWYYETYIDMRSTSYGLTVYVGYHTFKDNYRANAYWSSTNQDSVALYQMHTGQYWTWNGGSRSVTSGLGSIGASGVGKYVGIALNLDDNQITFYYDGSAITNGSNLALNNLGTDTDAGIFAIPAISVYDNNHTVNFGGYTKAPISSAQSDENGYGTFEHAPPSGYYALCSKNLAEYG